MTRRQPIHALKTPPRAILLNRKSRRVLGVLTDGFVDYGGGRAPADFLFWAGGFSGESFKFVTQKIHRENPPQNPPLPWRSFGRFSTIG